MQSFSGFARRYVVSFRTSRRAAASDRRSTIATTYVRYSELDTVDNVINTPQWQPWPDGAFTSTRLNPLNGVENLTVATSSIGHIGQEITVPSPGETVQNIGYT